MTGLAAEAGPRLGADQPDGPLDLLDGRLRVVVATTDQDLVEGVRALGDNLLVLDGAEQLTRNNAQVLVLGGELVRRVASFRNVRHARYVILAPATTAARVQALQAVAKHVLRGRLQRRGEARLVLPGGGSRQLIAFEVARTDAVRHRRWLSPELGVDGFLRALSEAQVRHVVLRWADELPDLPAGEDLDLLVDDDDLPAVEELLDSRPGTLPVDVYTRSGLPGTDWLDMAYHPPALARQLLDSACVDARGYSVPGAREQFLALAYHATYQKGDASGLPRARGATPVVERPDHDYAAALQRMAAALGLRFEPSLEALDAALTEVGWRPPRDTLAKLAVVVPWVAELQDREARARVPSCPGLAAFVLRSKAIEAGLVDRLIERIAVEGFTVVTRRTLDAAAAERLAAGARGANWGRGPWPLSGGGPAVLVLAVDVRPTPPDAALAARWPGLDNARLRVKDVLRDLANAVLPPDQQCNVVHASDTADQAEDYLRLAVPDEADALLAQARRLVEHVPPQPDVVRQLSGNGRRGWVELVRVDGRTLVRKTFRPGCERFLEREVLAATELARDCPRIPPLVARDASSLLLPYYDDVLGFDDRRLRLLPLRVVRDVLDVLRFFHDRGYAVVDSRPHNVVVDRHEGVKLVDFEFLHRYDVRPASFAASYDLAGLPPGFTGDVPVLLRESGWDGRWRPWVGLTVEQALAAPLWQQHLLRLRFRVLRVGPAWVAREAGRTRRRALRQLHRLTRR